MIWRLVADALRRYVRIYTLALVSFLAWLAETAAPSPSSGGMALSLAVAFVIGPVVAIASFSSREVALLPVSRRQLWLAQWVLGTVAAVGANTCAKFLGAAWAPPTLLLGAPIDPALLALSALYDFAYCGAFFGVLALAGTLPLRTVRYRRALTSGLHVLVVVAFVGGVVWPFLMAGLLPVRWTDVAGPAGFVLGVGLALTAAGYAYAPRAAARSSDRRPSASSAAPGARWRHPRFEEAASLGRLMAREGLLAFAFVFGLFALFVAAGMLPPSGLGFQEAVAEVLHPFLEESPLRYAGGVLPWLHAAWFAVLVVSGRNALVPMMHVLRAQPLSASRLNALFLSLSLPAWTGLATVVSAVEVVALDRQPSIAPGALVLFVGCTALGHTLHLWQGVRSSFSGAPVAVVFLAGLAVQILRRVPPLDVLADPAVVGGIMFALAAVLNHLAIARRSATYRPPAPGFAATPLA